MVTAGFGDAPISRALVLATAGSSIAVQAMRAARRPLPTYVAAWERTFVFRYPGELLVGAGLLYYFRLLERQSGSANFGGRVLVTGGLSYLLTLAAGAGLGWNAASGPYGLLFSCFVPFALEVPPLQHFTLCGLRSSDKAFIYGAGLQLLLSVPRMSLPAGLSGVIAGCLYQLNVFGLKRVRWESPSHQLPRWAGALFGSLTPRAVVRHAQLGRAAGQQVPPRHPAQAARQARAQLPEPSPAGVAQLETMGFSREQARRALQQTGNNVQAAATLLLE